MVKISIILVSILLFFGQCETPSVHLSDSTDPDIVLINIENGNRSFIGNVLLKLDSLNPILIGIDAYFQKRKDHVQDSTLTDALRKIQNDLLIYTNDEGKFIESDSSFTSLVDQTGLLQYDYKFGLISYMIPRRRVNKVVHESFALKIAKKWKPDLLPPFKINQEIRINYTRDLQRFITMDGSFLLETNINDFDLQNKVFLLGYIGPGNEDKHFTPLRFAGKYHDKEPDTYSPVIVANEIRTILDYKK